MCVSLRCETGESVQGVGTAARVWEGGVGEDTERGVVMAPLARNGSSTERSTKASDDPT